MNISHMTDEWIEDGNSSHKDVMYLRDEVYRLRSVLKVYAITDGYQWWSRECSECHKPTMQVVRPGKVQCSECG